MLAILQHLFPFYEVIDEVDLEENTIKLMEPYDPAEPLARLIKKIEKGREFMRAVEQTIDDVMMVSKGIAILEHASTFNDDIGMWR